MQKPFKLFKRKPQNIWYYQLEDQKTYHSTGCKIKAEAELFAFKQFNGEIESKPVNLKNYTKTFLNIV